MCRGRFTQATSGVANLGLQLLAGGVEHDKTVAAAEAATTRSACGGRAGSGIIHFGRGVDAGGNGLLQLLDRGVFVNVLLLALFFAQWPLLVVAQFDGLAIHSLQSDGAKVASQQLLALQQAVAFKDLTLNTFNGNGEYLADDALDDGNHAAHALTPNPFSFVDCVTVVSGYWSGTAR